MDVRAQRGFVLPALSPSLWLAAGLVLCAAIIYALWADRSRLAAERDQWTAAWAAQATETQRQVRAKQSAEAASKLAQDRAVAAQASTRRYRREIARLSAPDAPQTPGDECAPLLRAHLCSAVADSLRERAAGSRGGAVPDAAAAPERTGRGAAHATPRP